MRHQIQTFPFNRASIRMHNNGQHCYNSSVRLSMWHFSVVYSAKVIIEINVKNLTV